MKWSLSRWFFGWREITHLSSKRIRISSRYLRGECQDKRISGEMDVSERIAEKRGDNGAGVFGVETWCSMKIPNVFRCLYCGSGLRVASAKNSFFKIFVVQSK